jgi:hypothetical protein
VAVLSTQLLDHLFVQRPVDVPRLEGVEITVRDRAGSPA